MPKSPFRALFPEVSAESVLRRETPDLYDALPRSVQRQADVGYVQAVRLARLRDKRDPSFILESAYRQGCNRLYGFSLLVVVLLGVATVFLVPTMKVGYEIAAVLAVFIVIRVWWLYAQLRRMRAYFASHNQDPIQP